MVILEAMKMEHPRSPTLRAPKEVRVEVGQMVDPDFVMVLWSRRNREAGHC
jgi:hypothetical protein